MNIVLWIIQILLMLVFLLSGGLKFVFSAEDMHKAAPDAIQLPMMFVRFIGVCEILGALGLVLPGLTKIKRFLTPLAASGLLIIMIGAVVLSVMGQGARAGIFPFFIGLLCAVVAYGRRDWK
ncbi:MAG TPA: DoxX family protein [Pyrinomonadaceae bacterium]